MPTPDSNNRPEFFLSDAHFGAHDEATERVKIDRFISFMANPERDDSSVWFLGDLFDFWLEYRHVIPRVSIRVLAAIRAFVDRGGEFHLLIGNHDCWTRDFFSAELGATIHRADVELERGGKNILLTHGDGKARSDRGYRLLKKILRFRPGIWLFRLLPVDWAFGLAGHSSGASRRLTSGRENRFEAEYHKFAEAKLTAGHHAVIMGHLHKPILERTFTLNYWDK